jgi:hypothetical protein
MTTELNNFYLIEIRNDALSALFRKSYGLAFFAVVSDEFSNEIEAINSADESIKKILSDIKTPVNIEQKFNPIAFPTLKLEFQLPKIADGIYDNVHPNTIVRTIAKINDSTLISSRVVSTNPIDEKISIQ